MGRESTLPDISLIHGRLMVAAWEEGLEGVEEAAVKLALSAVEQQLRKIIFSLVKTRKGWQETSGLIHSVGSAAPNPWLLNTQSKRKVLTGDRDTAVAANMLNEQCLAPAHRTEADRAEAEALYSLSLSRPPRLAQPLGLLDLPTALHTDRGIIPNHSVYSINMERVILRLHPST